MKYNHLIIFAKNPNLSKSKTYTAKSKGEHIAIKVLMYLLEHTAMETLKVDAVRNIYYSSFIENDDIFNDKYFFSNVQSGKDMGERMYNSFKDSFGQWADKVILIGTDCFELDAALIQNAFEKLNNVDAVIGPSSNGSFYLLGLKHPHRSVFTNKKWTSENVFLDTLIDFKDLNLSYKLLPLLNDVYQEDNLGKLVNLLE